MSQQRMSSKKKIVTGPEKPGGNRRRFLGYLGSAPGLMSLGGASLLSTLEAPSALADTPTPAQRQQHAFVIRRDAAIFQRDRAEEPSVSNGDETRYPNKIASFTKALPHNSLGEVDLNAFSAMTGALSSGLTSDFEAIPLGGTVRA